jgi:hypothetical protein
VACSPSACRLCPPLPSFSGQGLPQYIKDHPVYYAGPAKVNPVQCAVWLRLAAVNEFVIVIVILRLLFLLLSDPFRLGVLFRELARASF